VVGRPGTADKVTTEGGFNPQWNVEGTELFYVAGGAMWVVPVATEAKFEHGPARQLFQKDWLSGSSSRKFAVSNDGQRFLMIDNSQSLPPLRRLVYVSNWFEELKRRELAAAPDNRHLPLRAWG